MATDERPRGQSTQGEGARVGDLRVGGVWRRPQRDRARAWKIGRPGGLAKRLGRVVLWLLVLVLLLRGLASAIEPRKPSAVVSAPRPVPALWPDDEARAFAAEFGRAWLTYSPADPEASAAAVRAFVAPEIASSVVPRYGENAPRRAVGSVSVARVVRVDDRRARITVAAAATGGTKFVVVPVARDARGGLVVSELPSLAAPPARASVPATTMESLPAGEREAIEDLVVRYLRSFVAGDAGALRFLAPAGVRVGAVGQRHELVDVTSLALAVPARGRVRDVVADARVRDAAGVTFGLRYRLRLVARDGRWLVAAVDSTTRRGG